MERATPSSASSPLVRVAGFWRRAAAGLVDAVVLNLLFSLLILLGALLLGRPLPRFAQLGPDYLIDIAVNGDALAVTAMVLLVILGGLYFAVFHAVLGQTLGKRLVRVRVIDGYGARPSLVRAAVRTASYVPSLLLLGLGVLWIGFDREKRGLHDWLADTYVIVGTPHAPGAVATMVEAAQ